MPCNGRSSLVLQSYELKITINSTIMTLIMIWVFIIVQLYYKMLGFPAI